MKMSVVSILYGVCHEAMSLSLLVEKNVSRIISPSSNPLESFVVHSCLRVLTRNPNVESFSIVSTYRAYL